MPAHVSYSARPDTVCAMRREPRQDGRPHLVPMVGEPGSKAIIAIHGAEQAYTAIAGVSWRNEVCARAALGVAFNRPIRFARRLNCPMLVQAGTHDSITPPAAARRAAENAGAELREYPVDHVDVYAGAMHQRALADQLTFLGRHRAPTVSRWDATTTTDWSH